MEEKVGSLMPSEVRKLRQPIELTAAGAMRGRDLPLSWVEQRQRLGFVG